MAATEPLHLLIGEESDLAAQQYALPALGPDFLRETEPLVGYSEVWEVFLFRNLYLVLKGLRSDCPLYSATQDETVTALRFDSDLFLEKKK